MGGIFTRVTIGGSHRVDVADWGVGVGIRLPVGSVRNYGVPVMMDDGD